MTNEYLLAYLLASLQKGEQFVAWPLHITLMAPWFKSHKPPAEIIKDLKMITKGFKPFSVQAIQRAQLGWRGAQVTLVASKELHDLHRALLKMLNQREYNLPKTKHVGENYQPHVTKKDRAELKPGHDVLVDRIYLVKAPLGNPRTRLKTVVAIVKLANE